MQYRIDVCLHSKVVYGFMFLLSNKNAGGKVKMIMDITEKKISRA